MLAAKNMPDIIQDDATGRIETALPSVQELLQARKSVDSLSWDIARPSLRSMVDACQPGPTS